MARRLVGVEHREVGDCLNALGIVTWRTGRHDEALAIELECLALRRRVLGPDHPHLIVSLGNVADDHLYLEQFEEAFGMGLPEVEE